MSFDYLNPKQREAVEHIDGPLLILVGVGLGKIGTISGLSHSCCDRCSTRSRTSMTKISPPKSVRPHRASILNWAKHGGPTPPAPPSGFKRRGPPAHYSSNNRASSTCSRLKPSDSKHGGPKPPIPPLGFQATRTPGTLFLQ